MPHAVCKRRISSELQPLMVLVFEGGSGKCLEPPCKVYIPYRVATKQVAYLFLFKYLKVNFAILMMDPIWYIYLIGLHQKGSAHGTGTTIPDRHRKARHRKALREFSAEDLLAG